MTTYKHKYQYPPEKAEFGIFAGNVVGSMLRILRV
jgi:hypothetical protein